MRLKSLFLASVLLGSTSGWSQSIPSNDALEFFADSAEAPDPTRPGPYAYEVVTSGLSNSAYRSAAVYLPKGEGPFPATTLCGGYSNSKEDMSWLGKLLASHGIIAIAFTPTNSFSLSASTWANGHVGSVTTLERENNNRFSPLFNKVATEKYGLMGYSFGGAGSILAASALGEKTGAVVPLNPYRPTVLTVDAPVLFITGTRDSVASPTLALQAFSAITSDAQPRAFANIKNGDHFAPLNSGPLHDAISALTVPWLKVFLGGDERYVTYFNGAKIDQVLEEGDYFAKKTDYIFIPAAM